MARLAGSFLIRLWRTGRTQRIEIQHIQSGEKELVTSVAEAVDWISTHAEYASAATPEQTRQVLDSPPEGEEERTVADTKVQ